MPKPLAIAAVFAVLFLAIAVAMLFVVPLTIDQVQLLATNLPSYATAAQSFIGGAQHSLSEHFPQLQLPQANLSVSSFTGTKLTGFVAAALASLGTIAINTADRLFVAFSAIILSFFFLLNDSQIVEWFAGMFPPNKRETARKLSAEVTQLFGNYIAGQIAVSAITGFVIAVASAAIGFKFSLILGIISAVAYAIPIIGMLIAEIVAVPHVPAARRMDGALGASDHVRNGAHQR